MERKQLKGAAILLLTALIWGSSFVAQSVGLESIGTFTFSAIRTLFGALVLLPVILIRERMEKKAKLPRDLAKRRQTERQTLVGGVILGIVFCIATNLQQIGLTYSSTGKVAFITAMYIIFVPLIGLFLKKRISAMTWICVGIGFVGLYFLCMGDAELGGMNVGDVFALLCSVAFAVHILLIERYANETDGVKLSCIQFLTCCIVSAVPAFLFEAPSMDAVWIAIIPLLYSGVMSSGVAYTLQIIGQKYTESSMASLIMCMESVFAVLAGALFLSERMSLKEGIGCAVMFVAITLPHVVELLQKKKEE